MTNREKTFDAFRNCMTTKPCAECRYCSLEQIAKDSYVRIPAHICLDAIEVMRDAIDIVHCKDCKYSYFANNRVQEEQSWVCCKNGHDVSEDWFCGDGDRGE